jgi:hypothetical protein
LLPVPVYFESVASFCKVFLEVVCGDHTDFFDVIFFISACLCVVTRARYYPREATSGGVWKYGSRRAPTLGRSEAQRLKSAARVRPCVTFTTSCWKSELVSFSRGQVATGFSPPGQGP